MDLEKLTWDYPHPLKDELWRATRLAEYFPFIYDRMTEEDKRILLKRLDEIKVPWERKELIRMMCGEEQDIE